MKRMGVGLPIVLIVTMAMSAAAVWAASHFREAREQRMINAAGRDVTNMMDAVDKYQALYTSLPRRLSDLNKVGYREGGGMRVCMFEYNEGETPRDDYLDIAIRHRSARSGAWTEYPGPQRMIKYMNIPVCESLRRGS